MFDYAVERSLIRTLQTNELCESLRISTQFLFVYPSIALHFQHLWVRDPSRKEFWETTHEIFEAEGVPMVAKLIAPAVAVESARILEDLSPLLRRLQNPGETPPAAGQQIVRHLVGCLLAADVSFSDPYVDLWCRWIVEISSIRSRIIIRGVLMLLDHLSTTVTQASHDQRSWIGAAARNLLQYAIEHPDDRLWLYPTVLVVVCRTIDSDPHACVELLEHLFEDGPLDGARIEGLLRLSYEIKNEHLVRYAPEITERLYLKVFGLREIPEGSISAGGQIIALTMSFRTHVDGIKYSLAESFSVFLKFAPQHAFRIGKRPGTR